MSVRKRPRIGVDFTSALTQVGGIGRYTRELFRAVAREGDDFRFKLFSARPDASNTLNNGVPKGINVSFRKVPISNRWLYRLWYRLNLPLPVQLFTGRIDLFHSPDFVLPPIVGSTPTLLTVHDLSFVHYPATFTPALVRFLNRVVPQSVAKANHILADSRATKNDMINLWNVAPDKITVLYSGVHHRFRPVRKKQQLAAVREKYGIGNKPYLLGLSTIQPRKNFQMLIRAFATIADKYPHDLVIGGGKGWLYDQILAETRSNNLAERVKFIGFVEDADLPALYSGATLFVFPSLYEGFGLPILEAMSCGVPVLTSNASCLPEVVGQAGVQLPPEDESAWAAEMGKLIDNPIDRTHLVAAGFLRARDFTWEKAAQKLLTVYETLLSE